MARGPVYDEKAIQECLKLYIKYGGGHFELIEQEMRAKGYVGWSRQNLVSKGKGDKGKQRLGWIERYNFERQLELYLARLPLNALNSAQLLVQEIEFVRKTVFEQLKLASADGGKIDRDYVWQHHNYSKLSIEALQKVQEARDTLGGFVSFWERLLEILHRIGAQKAGLELLKVDEKVFEAARVELGEQEDGLRPAPDMAKPAAPVEGSSDGRAKD